MGRELRRVPLDFSWPLEKTWEGFINPHGKPCPEDNKTCFNGYTAGGKWLETIVRLLETLADDAMRGKESRKSGALWPHPYLVEMPTAPHYDIPRGTPRERIGAEFAKRQQNPFDAVLPPDKSLVDLFIGLTGDKDLKPGLFGFMGGSACYHIEMRLLEIAGLSREWMLCPICKGDAMDPASKEAYENWKETPPPEGPGYQIWETVSEGSPVSPVFATKEELVKYMIRDGHSKAAAEAFADDGWVPSMVVTGGKMYTGIEAAAVLKNDE